MKYVVIFVVLAALGGGGWVVMSRMKAAAAAEAAPVQVTDEVVRTTIEKIVAANGIIASNRDVDIKCQASGTIQLLPYNDVNAHVKPGEVLCKLDPVDEQRLEDTAKSVVDADNARLTEATINWNLAKMALDTQRQRNEAALASAQARAVQARAKAVRTKQLFDEKLESQEDLEADQTSAAQADADVQTSQAAIAELDQQKLSIDTKQQTIKETQASLAQDQSRLDQAHQGVLYCTVTAPEATNAADPPQWVISSLLANIAPGYIVQSGTSGFSAGTTIMTLSDLSHIYMLASVAESDIGQVADPAMSKEAPQKVRVTVDAYQSEVFEGVVTRVAPKGVNTNNVVTFEVKIEITSANRLLLRPAMTATAKIICGKRVDVLAIPVAAFTAGGKRGGDASAASQADAASRPARGARGSRGAGRGASAGTEAGAPPNADAPVAGTVTVVKADKSTETRDVTVGLSDGEYYEVISGLDEGDTVVVNSGGQDSKWKGQNRGGSLIPRGMR